MFPYPASERKKGSWLIFHLLFPAGLTIFSIAFGFFILPMYKRSVISIWAGYVVLFGELFMFLLGTYGSYFNIKEQQMLYNVIDCIDRKFATQYSIVTNYKKSVVRSLTIFLLLLIILVTLKIIIRNDNETNLRYYSYLFIPSLFNQLKCFQITFYLNIMHEKLKLLHTKIHGNPGKPCYFMSSEITTKI